MLVFPFLNISGTGGMCHSPVSGVGGQLWEGWFPIYHVGSDRAQSPVWQRVPFPTAISFLDSFLNTFMWPRFLDCLDFFWDRVSLFWAQFFNNFIIFLSQYWMRVCACVRTRVLVCLVLLFFLKAYCKKSVLMSVQGQNK